MKRTPLKRSTKPLKRTLLAPVSKKRKKILTDYTALRKEYLSIMQQCERCGVRKSRDIHHTEGRGSNTNRIETWRAVCRPCHDWIHANPSQAREEGWLV